MIEKLDTTIEKLKEEDKLKTKWSDIDAYGIAELINILWQEEYGYGSIVHSPVVEKGTIFLNLYDGIEFNYEGRLYRLVKAYIDDENNIIFSSSSQDIFSYETHKTDAKDLKFYNIGD